MQSANHQNGLHSGAITLNSGGTFLLGTLSAGSSVTTTFSNTITFNGGTIRNYDASTNLLVNTLIGTTHTFTLGSGTPTFDIGSGRTGTINEVMSGSGSLTKVGAGTLILGAANTYTGLTTVSEGTLTAAVANALGTGAVTVNDATAIYSLGTFSDSVGTVTLDGGGQITSSTGVLTSTGTFEMKSGSASAILGGSGIGLNKTTAGTVTLTGVNTYTGATTISAGILAITHAFLSDTANVSIANPAMLALNFAGADTVGSLTINGVVMGSGTYGATGSGATFIDDSHFTGTGRLIVPVSGTSVPGEAFYTWATSRGLGGSDASKSANPSHDGIINFAKFALDGSPSTGGVTGKMVHKISGAGASSMMTLTVPILIGATANPADAPGGELGLIQGGVTYYIQASADLATWTQDVAEVTPALSSGLPALSPGYEYRTFRIVGPLQRDTRQFLRVSVSE